MSSKLDFSDIVSHNARAHTLSSGSPSPRYNFYANNQGSPSAFETQTPPYVGGDTGSWTSGNVGLFPVQVSITPTGLPSGYNVRAPFIVSWGIVPGEKGSTTVWFKSDGTANDGQNAAFLPKTDQTWLYPCPLEINKVWYCAKPKQVTGESVEIEYFVLGGVFDHPFKVHVVNTSTDPQTPTWKAGVSYNSSLFKSLKPDDKQTITGLLTKVDFTITDSGLVSIAANQYIWLEVAFNTTNGSVTGAAINNSGSDSFNLAAAAWAENAYVTHNGATPPKQDKARKLIAKILADSDGKLYAEQYMLTHQVLSSYVINGRLATYPNPL